MSVKIRVATADDMAFIVNAWLETYWSSDVGRSLNRIGREPAMRQYLPLIEWGQEHPSLYYGLQRKLCVGLLARCGALVACDPEGDGLYGFICADESAETPVLHYVCVKPHMHGHGVAKRLLMEAGFKKGDGGSYTHRTDDFLNNVIDCDGWVYRPELASV